MTPTQRYSLIVSARRHGITGVIVFGAMSAAFQLYDATNVSAAEFHAYEQAAESRHVLDTLTTRYQFREVRGMLFRLDTSLQSICRAVQGGCPR